MKNYAMTEYATTGPELPKIKCVKCGWEHQLSNNFERIGGEDVCLGCAGFDAPTCGKHGDY